jgi:hypothetical protein
MSEIVLRAVRCEDPTSLMASASCRHVRPVGASTLRSPWRWDARRGGCRSAKTSQPTITDGVGCEDPWVANLGWVREIIAQCRDGVAILTNQPTTLHGLAIGADPKGDDWDCWPRTSASVSSAGRWVWARQWLPRTTPAVPGRGDR